MNKYVLTIDNGLTKTKSVIFNMEGREIASSMINSPVENRGNLAEIDMEKQWINTARVIRETISKSCINNSDIVGVGNTACGAGLYLIDSKGGPIRKAILSMDGRAVEILEQWEIKKINIFNKTYQHMWNGQSIPLLYWLKMNEPENYKKTNKILMTKDWIKFKLIGEIATDYSDVSCSGLLNAKKQDYDIELFTPFGLEDAYNKLPEIHESTEIIGFINKKAAMETGLREGTPVIAGLLDVVASTLGISIV